VCHTIRGAGIPFAPDLTFEGSRVKLEWLRDFIKTPDFIRPLLKQMPRFHFGETTGMPGFQSDLDEVSIITSYIKSALVTDEIDEDFLANEPITAAELEAGEALYRASRCDFCHQIGDTGGALGPTLTAVGDRLTSGYVFAHLKDARRFVPDIVEPAYGFSDERAILITKFLMRRTAEAVTDDAR
jgi:mono/diheme cytochrome c family protein